MKMADLARFLLPICRQVMSTSFLLAICYQVMQQTLFSFILSPICWYSMLSGFIINIFDSRLLICLSDNTNSVYNLLLFCNQKLVADSAQNLSLQIWLSGSIYKFTLNYLSIKNSASSRYEPLSPTS